MLPKSGFELQYWMTVGYDDLGCETCRSWVWVWGGDNEELDSMKPFKFIAGHANSFNTIYQCNTCGTFWSQQLDSHDHQLKPWPLENVQEDFPETQLMAGCCEPIVVKNSVKRFLEQFFDNPQTTKFNWQQIFSRRQPRFQWTDQMVSGARNSTGAREITTASYERIKDILRNVCGSAPTEAPESSDEGPWPVRELRATDQQTGVQYQLQICEFYPIATLRMVTSDGKRLRRATEIDRRTSDYSRIVELQDTILWLARQVLRQ